MHYNEINCVHFLTELFAAGKSYSALNSAHSALSCFLVNNAGVTIGNDAAVKRFMKGVFELNPPRPRYKFIWDVGIVLDFLRFYSPNKDMPLNILTFNTRQAVIPYHLVGPCDVILTSLKNFRLFNGKQRVYRCITSINDF